MALTDNITFRRLSEAMTLFWAKIKPRLVTLENHFNGDKLANTKVGMGNITIHDGAVHSVNGGVTGLGFTNNFNRANRIFGLPWNTISVDFSTDAGNTWQAFPDRPGALEKLTINKATFEFSPGTQHKVGDQLRFTFGSDGRYCLISNFLIRLLTNGCTLLAKVEKSTDGGNWFNQLSVPSGKTYPEPHTWADLTDWVDVSGWPGCNEIVLARHEFFGQTKSAFRLTFKIVGLPAQNYGKPYIFNVCAQGHISWDSVNPMMDHDLPFDFDANQNLSTSKYISAQSFKTDGGNSSQFVKGDGSLDSTAYQPKTDNALKTSDKTVVGALNEVKRLADDNNIRGSYGADMGGYMMYTDPTFKNGVNDITKYQYTNLTTSTLTRVQKSVEAPDAPNGSDFVIKITNTPTSPTATFSGFYFGNPTRANAVFVYKIIAKIPAGKTLQFGSNSLGDAPEYRWLTSNNGTGKFETYIFRVQCDGKGVFSTTGYFYIAGITTTEPFDWYVAYATCYDMTREDSSIVVTKQIDTLSTKVSEVTTVATNAKNSADESVKAYVETRLTANQALDKATTANNRSFTALEDAKFAVAPKLSFVRDTGKIVIYHPLIQDDGLLPEGYQFVFLKYRNNKTRPNRGQGRYPQTATQRMHWTWRNGDIHKRDAELKNNGKYPTLFISEGSITYAELKKFVQPYNDAHPREYRVFGVAVCKPNPDFPISPATTAFQNFKYPHKRGIPKFLLSDVAEFSAHWYKETDEYYRFEGFGKKR